MRENSNSTNRKPDRERPQYQRLPPVPATPEFTELGDADTTIHVVVEYGDPNEDAAAIWAFTDQRAARAYADKITQYQTHVFEIPLW